MRIHHTFVALSLIATLLVCAGAQDKRPDARPVPPETPPSAASIAKGEIVADIDPSYGGVFQDTDHNYWFSGGGQGVYRYDGKAGGTITRFTTKDGLPSDQVGGIQQHDPTGDIILSTADGFSRFDG